ncbi:MAG: 3-deoxy-D-manno-octulosonic acid transferase [Gammaproteobacteria bacterium]|nr:3-deoxy-D-manno-octulosonic acid transferase [Gammaproteobacteria bacterium]
MPRLLYTLLYYSLIPLLLLRSLIKHQKSRSYKEQRQPLRLAERFGLFSMPNFSLQPIWFHTVSVGEFLATLPLIKKIRMDFPNYPIVITCTTTTGSTQIKKTFSEEIKSGQVFHVYLPYDLPGSMKRFMNTVNPCLGLIMETEIWPNLLHESHKKNIPVWLLNARMSANSEKGYARFESLIKTALNQFSGIAVQNKVDAERLKKLGANDNLLHVTGSIKFDLKLNKADIKAGKELRNQLNWQNKKVLIAASTHQGEDEIILRVYAHLKKVHENLVMIIVPRHPERFQSVYELLNSQSLTVLKRSQMGKTVEYNTNSIEQKEINILLGDSMGEMIRYFSCSDTVFMGGTMVSNGGHNILEPAALSLPIIYGPHMFNFAVINDLFQQQNASLQVQNEASLTRALNTLLSDDALANDMGGRARALMMKHSGAVEKISILLSPHLE